MFLPTWSLAALVASALAICLPVLSELGRSLLFAALKTFWAPEPMGIAILKSPVV
jgi:hypothetical protein